METPRHEYMEVARTRLWAPGCTQKREFKVMQNIEFSQNFATLNSVAKYAHIKIAK